MELTVSLCPIVPGAFDAKVCINIKESKSLSVKVTGSVEAPRISVGKVSMCTVPTHSFSLFVSEVA